MDRLEAMSIFVAVVEQGSLAAAARILGHSPATVTRAVMLLESRSGERLLHRNARRLRLTESGERHIAIYRAMLGELAGIEGSPRRRAEQLEGSLAITAPELFGRLKVMPLVEDFLAVHPRVRARVLLLNRLVNLVEEGVDLAVRLAPLPDSGNVAVGLGEVRGLVCAAPTYFRHAGMPAAPADLAGHRCLGEDESKEREPWRFVDRRGARSRALTIAIQPRIALNSAGAAIDAAVRGHGICRAFSYQVIEHLEARRLATALAAFEPEPTPVHLVFHRVPQRNWVLRAFIDYVTPRLRAELADISKRMQAQAAKGSKRGSAKAAAANR